MNTSFNGSFRREAIRYCRISFASRAVLLLLSLFSGAPAAAASWPTCLDELANAAEPLRVYPAMAAVLTDWARDDRPLPEIFPTMDALYASYEAEEPRYRHERFPRGRLGKSAYWEQLRGTMPVLVHGSRRAPVACDASSTCEVEIDGTRQVFRALDDAKSVPRLRRTLAAYLLNRRAGLHTVADAWLVRVTDAFSTRYGVMSTYLGPFQRIVGATLDARARSNTAAFEFLLGNCDVDAEWDNYRLYDGRLYIVDHDYAFAPGIPVLDSPTLLVGSRLPERYTQEFLDALRGWDETALRTDLERFLTDREIAALWFRRATILKDAELRGADALFP